nr:glycosyl hydrolase 53 family protein [Bacilli bacterium]
SEAGSSVTSDSLYVKKVENLPDDFIFGMDASSVPSLEKSGVKFYDFDGTEKDVFEILSANGINYIRVRVWNDPFDSDGHGYGGGNCDINVAKEIGLRATKYGMKLLVDFHYSDFWADPAKYQAPKAWEGKSPAEKGELCYEFTKQSLQTLKDAGVDVGMVQIGNETNNGLSGENNWFNMSYIFDNGSKAVREVLPDALVAVHFANPEKTKNYQNYASKLDYYQIDYDVFGTSYYPYWHGTLDNLSNILSEIAEQYGKKTMVLETSYANTLEDTDFSGNTIGPSAVGDYPFTVAGQTNHMVNLTDTIVNHTKNGIGVCYWEGTWISVGTTSWEENVEKWKEYGSGWSSEYSASYENDDAGVNGGSAVDNQCFFDPQGHALESLKSFALMKSGNEVTPKPDGVENPTATMYTYDENFKLPETVNVIYTDNSKRPVEVEWETFDLAAARKAGNANYSIKGVADGYDVVLALSVLEYNFIQNYSFEESTTDPWVITKRNADQIGDNYVCQVTNENPLTGSYAFHFWAKSSNTAGFDMEQAVTIENAGTYKYSFSLMGGNGGGEIDPAKQDIYGYVKVDGEIVKKIDAKYTGYSKTYENGTYVIEGLELDPSKDIKVGIHLFANEAGAWGDVDDFMLNIVL